MTSYKKILITYWPVISLFLLSVLISWPLFNSGYFSHHDDLQVMRIFEMRRCFSDLQLPCRWVPDMGYGFGFPEFNYYGVFPYYLGAIFSYVFGYIWAAKILFLVPLMLGGFSVYILSKEIFGKYPGFIAGVLYLFAPYRALDSYVRGAIAESFAIAIAPLLFYFIYKLIKEKTAKYLVLFVCSLAIFLTCHNIMTLMFAPILIIWTFFWLVGQKFKNISTILLAFILGIGLSAFFTLPAFFEKNLVQTDSLIRGDLNYLVHFVTAPQLFLDRSWGYGASFPGPNDTISFQIGWPHWWMIILLPVALFIYRRNVSKKLFVLGVGLLLLFIGTLFMMHLKSVFIWEKVSLLQFAQFPWRFLSISIFVTSIAGGFFVSVLKENFKLWTGVIIVGLTIILNVGYFKPDHFYPLTDEQKLSGKLWEEQQRASVLDYLPITALQPREPAQTKPLVLSGSADVYSFENYSNKWKTYLKVNNSAEIAIPVFDFPIWEVKVNDKKYENLYRDDQGRISLSLSPGSYKVEGKFTNTKVRYISNTISTISLFILFAILVFRRLKK